MKAYYYSGEGDQRLPHEGLPVPSEHLSNLGILTWSNCPLSEVDSIAQERGYSNRDEITISPTLLPDYEKKVKGFFNEHLHEDEEIRYILDGEGYFDVRDKEDTWIRMSMTKGDVAVLPAGIYHRFTTGESNYIKAMRLFKDSPKWVPLNRSQEIDENKYRQEYVASIQ